VINRPKTPAACSDVKIVCIDGARVTCLVQVCRARQRSRWFGVGCSLAAGRFWPLAWLVVTSTFIGCDLTGPQQPPTEPRTVRPSTVPVLVTRPDRVDAGTESLLCYGRLVPRRQSRLGFARGGRVEQVVKGIGQLADQGELLAEIEQPELKERLERVQQSLYRAERAAAGANPAAAGSAANGSGNQQRTAQQQVDQLERQLAELEIEVRKGQIFAPYDSIIAERRIDPATQIGAGNLALSVIEQAPPRVEVDLPRAGIELLRQGGAARIELEKELFPATAEYLSPSENAVGGRTAWLRFTGELPRDRWYFGRTVTVHYKSDRGEAGFRLPIAALQRRAGEVWSIFTAEPIENSDRHAVVRQAVRIVGTEEDSVIVQGSINEQTLVIEQGTHRIVHGQEVTITEPSESAIATESDP